MIDPVRKVKDLICTFSVIEVQNDVFFVARHTLEVQQAKLIYKKVIVALLDGFSITHSRCKKRPLNFDHFSLFQTLHHSEILGKTVGR